MRRPVIPLVLAVAVACAAGVLLRPSPSPTPVVEWENVLYFVNVGLPRSEQRENTRVENLVVWAPFYRHFENLRMRPEFRPPPEKGEVRIENTHLGPMCVISLKVPLPVYKSELPDAGYFITIGWECAVPKGERPFENYENLATVYVSYDYPDKPVKLAWLLIFTEQGFRYVREWPDGVMENLDRPELTWYTYGTGYHQIQAHLATADDYINS
jgi:hypothetical protein